MSTPLSGPMQAAAKHMRADFEDIARQHRGLSGGRREDTVREFLDRYLPERFGVATGEVVSTAGDISPQIDIIVYDRVETSLFDQSSSSAIVPVEGVLAAVEVGTKLDSNKLREDALKLAAVKRMQFALGCGRTRTPLTACFGFDSIAPDALVKELAQLDVETLPDERLDSAFVLDKFAIHNQHMPPTGGMQVSARHYEDWVRGLVTDATGTAFELMLFYSLFVAELEPAPPMHTYIARYSYL